jgi:hypothetical protein
MIIDKILLILSSIACEHCRKELKEVEGSAIDEAAQYYRLPEWIGLSTAPSASLILGNS